MKKFQLSYYANHYANGGNWTHIVKVWDEENRENMPIALEDDRATDIKRKLQPYLSGNSLMGLTDSMKYRTDYQCSLLLSDRDCEFLKSKPEMQTYTTRNPMRLTS